MRSAVVLAAALAVVAGGCGSGARDARPARVSADRESAWVAKARAWFTVETLQGNFRHCARRTARRIGAAPADDLAPLERSIASMCRGFDRAYGDLDSAFAEHDAAAYARSQREMAAAQRRLERTKELVDEWRPGRPAARLATRRGVTSASRVEPLFSRVATALAGERVRVRCWSTDEWRAVVAAARGGGAPGTIVDLWGLADETENAVDLAPRVCRSLVALAYRHAAPAEGALGAGVLAHEATHLRGDAGADEATVECYGLQRAARAARLLGARPAAARLVAQRYLGTFHTYTPAEYRTSACRPDGPLDLTPGDGRWP